eukprot:1154839-Pelagomonas_calceolata.AAC.2
MRPNDIRLISYWKLERARHQAIVLGYLGSRFIGYEPEHRPLGFKRQVHRLLLTTRCALEKTPLNSHHCSVVRYGLLLVTLLIPIDFFLLLLLGYMVPRPLARK